MDISVISFTESGYRLSEKIESVLDGTKLYTKCSYHQGTDQFVHTSIGIWTAEQMTKKNVLIFIGACGIAVRSIAPYVSDKRYDSPVIVIDELGQYVIPILSGHIGGANEIAVYISEKINAIPVITTATDLRQKFAVDLFAKKNHLFIVNKDGIAKVSAKVLAGNDITVAVENGHLRSDDKIPAGIHIVEYPPRQTVDIVISMSAEQFDAAIHLIPMQYAIGMGCRRGKEAEKIADFICKNLNKAGIDERQIFALASVDKKRNESGLVTWSRQRNIPFITYASEVLQEVAGNFKVSDFVKETVGVDNVCERAAIKACKASAQLILGKYAEDGMTIAIAKRDWSVSFDEE